MDSSSNPLEKSTIVDPPRREALPSLLEKVKEFARCQMAKYDNSHDFNHLLRVERISLKIAKGENYQGDLEFLRIAVFLHDVGDHKYTGNDTDGPKMVRSFLESINYPEDKIKRVCFIHQEISFTNELGKSVENDLELNIIRDADRLDAMGVMGIIRAITYGAIKGRPFYLEGTKYRKELDKETYQKETEACTVHHFHEKLLRLEGLMRTKIGKEMAQHRHDYMEEFLEEFHQERKGIV
uniref:Metal dependent phosphohydrolase n=1 Tax=Pithovirus LCPAC201 TaxID=2506591 RepID=A0A481Z6E1_9VIRU|nr:MAG: metal dependent phosphohydrolase [Pithovirus LCPAC201]